MLRFKFQGHCLKFIEFVIYSIITFTLLALRGGVNISNLIIKKAYNLFLLVIFKFQSYSCKIYLFITFNPISNMEEINFLNQLVGKAFYLILDVGVLLVMGTYAFCSLLLTPTNLGVLSYLKTWGGG